MKINYQIMADIARKRLAGGLLRSAAIIAEEAIERASDPEDVVNLQEEFGDLISVFSPSSNVAQSNADNQAAC